MNIFLQFVFGFFSTAGFSLLFNTPKKSIFPSGIIGAFGWVFYKYLILSGRSILASCLISAIIIGLFSSILSRVLKMPSIILFSPAIIPLVPGGGMYYTMYYLIMQDMKNFSGKALETTLAALAIALGIYISTTSVNILSQIFISKK